MAPSREALLRTRVTTIAAYATAVHSELKMPKARSLALYGSAIVPIPIPLRPDETLEQFEARFRVWLFRERNRTVESIRLNANVERSCRFAFARAEARAHWAAETAVKGEDDEVKDEDFEVKTEPGLADRTVVLIGFKRERDDDAEEDDEEEVEAAPPYRKVRLEEERAPNSDQGGSPHDHPASDDEAILF